MITWTTAPPVVPGVEQILGRGLPCVAGFSQIPLYFFTKVWGILMSAVVADHCAFYNYFYQCLVLITKNNKTNLNMYKTF